MNLTEKILRWADRLRDMSAMGLRFANNEYDHTRYVALQDMSMEMQALAAGELPADLEPMRLPVWSRPTPLTCSDAAVIDTQGRILLIRRADTQDWAMPGGALEVGEAPVEGALRETLEETGVACRPLGLVGLFDTNRCGAVSRFQLIISVFLCEPAPQDEGDVYAHKSGQPVTATPNEVLDVRWFAEDELPPDIHIGHALRIREAYRVWHGDRRAYFDAPDGRATMP